MASFETTLKSGKFVVTAELNPPKGTDLNPLIDKAELLRAHVDAFNLTDSAGGVMTMSPIAPAAALVRSGIEPILQLTASGRNRIALQGDLLAAYALGVRNLLCMSGDPPSAGDHPDARPVFDLDTVAMLAAVGLLGSGKDLAGKTLHGRPTFFSGAVADPAADDLDAELLRMEAKVAAGARFFQTQPVFDVRQFERLTQGAKGFGVPVIAGSILLRSPAMARRLNDTLGVHVPGSIVEELEAADDKRAASLQIASRLIAEVRELCRGIHVMAVGWEAHIPALLEAAGVSAGASRRS